MNAPEHAQPADQPVEIDLTGKIRQLHEEAARRATGGRKARRTRHGVPAAPTAPPPAAAGGVRPWYWAPKPKSRPGPDQSPGERLRQAVDRAVEALANPGVMARVLARTGKYIAPYTGRDVHGLYAWEPTVGIWRPDDGRAQITADIEHVIASWTRRIQALVIRMLQAAMATRRARAEELAKKQGRNPQAAVEQVTVDDLRYDILNKLNGLTKKVNERYIEQAAMHVQVLTRSTEFARYLFSPEPWDTIVIPVHNGNILIGPDNQIKLEPVSPHRWTLYRLPWEYDPEALVPDDYLRLCHQWFAPDTDTINPWQELHGLLISRVTAVQEAAVLVGAGKNGKSTALNIMRALLGVHNTSSETLQNLTTHRFSLYNLEGKLANICADLPQNRIKDASAFKAATGGDVVTIEQKYRQPRNTLLWARMVFSANTIPPSDDRSEGYFRRWLPFRFKNVFAGEEDYSTEVRKANESGNTYNVYHRIPDVDQTIIRDQKKMSGLLNWAIDGLIRLRSRNWEFTTTSSMRQAKQEFRESSDLIEKFLNEMTEQDPAGAMVTSVAYRLFRLWWVVSGISKSPPGKQTYNRAMAQDHPRAYRAWHTADGGRTSVDCWIGLSLRQDAADALISEAARSHRREVAEAVHDLTGWLPPVLRRPGKDEPPGWEHDSNWDTDPPQSGTYRYYYPRPDQVPKEGYKF